MFGECCVNWKSIDLISSSGKSDCINASIVELISRVIEKSTNDFFPHDSSSKSLKCKSSGDS